MPQVQRHRAAGTFVPGSNVIGDESAANWLFVLPSLEYRTMLYLGRPSLHELSELSRRFELVTISTVQEHARAVREDVEAAEATNVTVIESGQDPTSGVRKGGVDVIRYNDRRAFRRLLRNQNEIRSLRRLLNPAGVIFGEILGARSASVSNRRSREVADLTIVPYWLSPVHGNAEHFSPLLDQHIADRLLRHGGYRSTFAARMSQRVHWSLLNRPGVRKWFGRYGALVGQSSGGVSSAPPLYLRRLASESGLDFDECYWGLWAGGRFLSKKVLFFLHQEPGGPPQYVVKMTRTPELNGRLENSYRALTELQKRNVLAPGALPEVAMFGYHGGLAILGESIIEGEPFEDLVAADPDGHHLDSVLALLQKLGAATQCRSSSSITTAVQSLRSVFEQFADIYDIDAEERSFLDYQVRVLERADDALSTVFQHGDCGTWNIMTRSDGRITFLDWEATDPNGLPLWDLFYFVQTYINLTVDSRESTDPVHRFERTLFSSTDMSQRVGRAISEYRVALDLDQSLVEPLFYTCWMHRALKESARLDPARLNGGQYVRLLRLCIRQRGSGALDQLLSTRSVADRPT